MKKFMVIVLIRTVFSYIFFLSISKVVFAKDMDKFTKLGFSSEGAYFAFMTSGVHDGSGQFYADIKFLDVLNNRYVEGGIKKIMTDKELQESSKLTLVAYEKAAMEMASLRLNKLGILSNNQGDILVSRKITDVGVRGLNEASFSLNSFSPAKFNLLLTTTNAKAPVRPKLCGMSGSIVHKLLKVELINLENKKSVILQEDHHLSVERECVHKYELEEIIVFTAPQQSSKLVVVIRTYSPGFEGDDVRFMIISGILPGTQRP